MQFALYDAVGSGNQVGQTIDLPAVQVVNGVFTVQLDYGPSAFRTQDVFIEIRPFSTQTNVYVTLNPRQKVTAAPFAMQSINAVNASIAGDSSSLGGIAANQYLQMTGNGSALTNVNAARLGGIASANYVQANDGRLTDSRNQLPGSVSYIQNSPAFQILSNFSISGAGKASTFTATGTIVGNDINSTTNYKISGATVFSSPNTTSIVAGPLSNHAIISPNNAFFWI
jgi:hypothetical protein